MIKSSSGDTQLVDGKKGCRCDTSGGRGCWHYAAGCLLYYYAWELYEGENLAVFDESFLDNADGNYISEEELEWVRDLDRAAGW